MTPTLSIVIPCYNRPEPLKYTLRSVARAIAVLAEPVEVLLVDDGSQPPIGEQLAGFDAGVAIIPLLQPNQGSIVARRTGLTAARGEYVHFLDSDDLVHPEKYAVHLRTQRALNAEVTYDDLATATLGADYTVASYTPVEKLPAEKDPAQFYVRVQPSPHSPIYRRDYLQSALAHPLVAPQRAMDPSGDVWLFYNLSVHAARIEKIDGAYTAAGPHEEDRYSRQWERLGVAALLIMEAFIRACPREPSTLAARTAVGEAAFRSWRALPRDFHDPFARRMLAIWQEAPHGDLRRLGTGLFARLAGGLGPVAAARLLRLWRAKPYAAVRTLSPEAYAKLFAEFKSVAS